MPSRFAHVPTAPAPGWVWGGGPDGFALAVCADTHLDAAGLDLAIARSIAEAHGGSLELAGSGPGGSTFLLRLPHETPCAAPAPSLTSV